MRLPILILTVLLLLSLAVPFVTAASNYTENFTSTEIVRANQSLVQDPLNGRSEPWDLWVYSGLIALGLLVLSWIKPRVNELDYEMGIVMSIAAWPFSWYWTWGCLSSIDYIAGVGITSTNSESVMITQHILYTWPILGWIGVTGDVVCVFITCLLIMQFRLFRKKETEREQEEASLRYKNNLEEI